MSRRRLDSEEYAIWKHVTRSISPLAKRRAAEADDEPPPSPKSKSPVKVSAKPAHAAPKPASRPQPVPVPAPLGRKARRRLARGADAIDGRLDLHGMTQAQAHDALLRFLHRSQTKGAKVVLVITGKGARGDSGLGVLKRQVPMWLRLPEFRDLIVGFETASIGHGGEGALYVRLRRLRA